MMLIHSNRYQSNLEKFSNKFTCRIFNKLNQSFFKLNVTNNAYFENFLDKLSKLLYTYLIKVGMRPPFVLLNCYMIYQTQLEANIYEISRSRLQTLGYEIVRIRILNLKNEKTLQLMVERIDSADITLRDCETISKHLSVIFDIESIINTNYRFEVSSAGLNKPLTRFEDFEKNIGSIIKVITKIPIDDQRKFTGRLIDFSNNILTLQSTYAKSNTAINFDMILESQLDYFATNTKTEGEKH